MLRLRLGPGLALIAGDDVGRRAAVRRRGRGLFSLKHVPHGDPVPPPELARDAPVPDVGQPLLVRRAEARGDQADVARPDGLQRGRCQRLHADKPLLPHQGLDDLPTPLRAGDAHRVRGGPHPQAGRLQVSPNRLARLEPVHARVSGARASVQGAIVRHDVGHRQAQAQADLIVGRIVRWRDFQGARPKLRVDGGVRDDGNGAPSRERDNAAPAHQVAEPGVARVDGDGLVARNGLRAGGRDRQEFSFLTAAPTTLHRVPESVERAGFLRGFNLQVGHRGAQPG